MADDLREFFERKEISEAHLVGHSLGGKIAMQLASSYPDQVKKLAVVDIAPKAYPPSQRPLLTALQRLELQSFKSFGEIDAALAECRKFLGLVAADQVDEAAIAARLEQLTKEYVSGQFS